MKTCVVHSKHCVTRSRYLQRNVAMAQAQMNVKWKVHESATLVQWWFHGGGLGLNLSLSVMYQYL